MGNRRDLKPAGQPDEAIALLEQQVTEAEQLAGLGRWAWSRQDGLMLSDTLQRLLGLPPSPSVRQVLRGAKGLPFLKTSIRDAEKGGKPVPFEMNLVSRAGSGRCTVTVTVRSMPGGEGLWGLCHDISNYSQVVAALNRSESRWEIALETARQGVWDSDLVTGIVHHSRTWRSIRGLDPERFDSGDQGVWADRVHPEDRAGVMRQIARMHRGEIDRMYLEYRERHRSGRYIWISSHGAAVEWFPDGLPKRVIGTDTDITARKEAESRVLRMSRRLQLALKVSRVGVFEADLVTGRIYWDARVREMYGVAPGAPITPRLWETCLHPEDAEGAIERVRRAVAERSSYLSDFRIIRRDTGEVRHMRTQGTWYEDSLGTPHMLGANWDMTVEVKAHEDLRRAKELAEARNIALESAKARIEYNALHDTLTDLPNRRYLDQELADRAKRAAASREHVALLHIDLDRFKQINDTLGHVAGDAMLVHAARLLRRNVGPDDFVARVGGDEFIVVRSGKEIDGTLKGLAGAIVDQMRRPVPYQGHDCRFGASIGIAVGSGAGLDPQRLLIDADIALYRAKARGKNGFEFFTAELQAETITAKQTADDILQAIEQDAFTPHYQPLFDARTMQLCSVEALVRWQHRSQLLTPDRFLKVAEDLNAVTVIDGIVLRKALADFKRWRSLGFAVPAISVNVSFKRLRDEQLLDSLKALDVPPGVLCFELLESIFLDEPDEMVAWNLDRIRELGIDLAIDDFGTGHASILSLLRLRPKRFKIDRQFLDALTSSLGQQRLVRSLIEIGHSLGIDVVAEGVESMEQAELLRDMGCDMLQGYALARPMSAEAFEAQLSRFALSA